MMPVAEMTAKEMRNINPTKDQLMAAVDYLIFLGWSFKAETNENHPPYTWGWWINPNHPTKNRPCGDPGNFHFKAWDTLKAYVAR